MSLMDWIGFVTGVLCVFLIVREKDVNWPIGLLNSVALLIVFWTQKLYAQAALQAFYVAECAYGWRMWTRKDRVTGARLIRIGRTRGQTLFLLSVIGIAGTLGLYPIFRATGDPAPFWDSMIAVMSLLAEYMLCLKVLFVDTDTMITRAFSEHYYGKVPPRVEQIIHLPENQNDFYLFTSIEIPWVPDSSRDLGEPELRARMQRNLLDALVRHGKAYAMVSGSDREGRLRQAIDAIDRNIFGPGGPPEQGGAR